MIAEVVFLFICLLQSVVCSYSRLEIVELAEMYNNDATNRY